MKDLGRRFALGARMPRFARTVGRTSRLNVAGRARALRHTTTGRSGWIDRLAAAMRELGPWAALALILPGGSLIALAAWAFRHRVSVTPASRLWIIVAAFGAALLLPVNA